METILNAPKGTMTELLNLIEQLTGRRFLGGHHRKELVTAWFNCEDHAWFSNRPFPIGTDSLPPDRRLATNLPDSESFFRIDLELRNHNAIPTDADIRSALAEAQSLGAMGAVRTPHGLHVYLFASRPLTYGNGEVRHLLEVLWPKHLALKVCSASWSRNNWSRYVLDLIFFNPSARVDVDRLFLSVPMPTVRAQVTEGSLRHIKSTNSSEPEHNEECSQIMGALWRGRGRDEIAGKLQHHTLDELDALIVRTQSDPDYKLNGKNTTGRKHRLFSGGKNSRCKYWTKEGAPVGLVGPHSSSRQIQVGKCMFKNFGHSVQRIWDAYSRRYHAADDYDKIHLRNEAIGAAMVWVERSYTAKAELFRLWWQQQFPGKDERGVAHWWMAAHEDIERLWHKYGPDGVGRKLVGQVLKGQILQLLEASPHNTPQLAKKLHYSDRQVRRGMRELESEGLIHSIGQHRNMLWRVTQPADQDGENGMETNPDIQGNPIGDYPDNCLPSAGRYKGTVGAKMVELPRKRALKGMTRGKKNLEKRRRAYVRQVRGLKAQLRPVDLIRLISLPLPHFEFWTQRMEDFRQEWAEYCRWRWVMSSPGRRAPEFAEWLSTQRERVYTNLSPAGQSPNVTGSKIPQRAQKRTLASTAIPF
jgi:hypothetical protein